jgi:hypothetical protein
MELDPKLLKRDGDIVMYGSNAPQIAVPFVPMILKNVRLRFFIVYNPIADAHELVEQARSVGNVVLEIG